MDQVEDEVFFADDGICVQSSCMIKQKDGTLTNGISLILTPENPEIILTYEELVAAVKELEEDRQFHYYENGCDYEL